MAGEGSVFRRCGCTDPVTGRQYGTRCPRLGAGGRHGSWYVRLELPGGLDGRRRRIRRGGYPSRKAALEVLARLRNPKAGGTGGIITVGDWLAHWLVPAPPRPRGRSCRGRAVPARSYGRRTGSRSGGGPGSGPPVAVDRTAYRAVPGLDPVAPAICRLSPDQAARLAAR
jgi:hypothetical protein